MQSYSKINANDLENLNHHSIRRRLSQFDSPVLSQIIDFCDASERTHAAVVYLCTFDHRGNIDSYLISAKTKVALKNEFKVAIPKLKLQAAELLYRLLQKMSTMLSVSDMFAFSDSTTVLAWLNSDISR